MGLVSDTWLINFDHLHGPQKISAIVNVVCCLDFAQQKKKKKSFKTKRGKMSDKSSSKSRKVLHEIATFKVRIVVFGDNKWHAATLSRQRRRDFEFQSLKLSLAS